MARNIETRLARLEAAQEPSAVVHMIFAQTDEAAAAEEAERIENGRAHPGDEFIVVRWLDAVDGRAAPITKLDDA
jgi:hypothetical protein